MSIAPVIPNLGEVLPPVPMAEMPFAQWPETVRVGLERIVSSVLGEDKSARRSEVRKAWQQRLFKAGTQNLDYDDRSYSWQVPSPDDVDLPRFRDVYNIYTPHLRSFVSILSQNPPGINFKPDSIRNFQDITAAAYAEKLRALVDRQVHMKDRQTEAATNFCTDGRTVVWTRLEGQNLVVSVHGVLESKVPIFARDMDKWPYCVLSEEIDLEYAKSLYPDFADKMKALDTAAPDSMYERYARLNILSNKKNGGYEGTFKNLTTRHYAWVMPFRYGKAGDDVEATLKADFLSGLRVTLVGGVAVDAEPCQGFQGIAVGFPSSGNGYSRPSLLHDVVPLQQTYNDIKNMLRENAEYGIPATWVDSASVDSEALAEQRSQPGAVHPITLRNGQDIRQAVLQETPAEISAQVVAMLADLKQDAEFTTGDFPSLYGAGTPDSETYSGQKLLSDQAKGQLSTAWGSMQWLFAKVYQTAISLAAQMYAGQQVGVEGASGSQQFDPGAILDGKWGAYPDTDSSFPETTTDKRQAYQLIAQQLAGLGDAGTAILGQPDNLKLGQTLFGLSDFVIPGAEARDKQLGEIEELLQGIPIPNVQDPQFQQQVQQWIQDGGQQSGQPEPQPPMQPSVPIDAQWDFHADELAKVKQWLSSNERREAERTNPQGVMNVRLHGQAHQDALDQQQQAQQNAAKQQTPMAITGGYKDLPPDVQVQVLQRDGYTADPSYPAIKETMDAQGQAAETQLTAANAQHKAVLAAREAQSPMKPPAPKFNPNAAPESEKLQ